MISPERPPSEGSRVPGTAGSLLAFFEDLRSEGVAVGTSEILDAFAALDEVSWTDQRDFREALASTIAKSQEDRRVFELLFDRHFFRAAEVEAGHVHRLRVVDQCRTRQQTYCVVPGDPAGGHRVLARHQRCMLRRRAGAPHVAGGEDVGLAGHA